MSFIIFFASEIEDAFINVEFSSKFYTDVRIYIYIEQNLIVWEYFQLKNFDF